MNAKRAVTSLLRRKALLIAAAWCLAGYAQANPTNPTVISGAATFAASGKSLNVTNTPGAIINWQGFSVKADELTRFIQQNAQSAVLNRVTGQERSAILGQLLSNGRVYLINPNGITVGAGARIDTAGFVASSLNLSDKDALAGKFKLQDTGSSGKVINNGTITTPTGGFVYLVAPNVENNGIITSPKGEIVLAAGKSVELVDSQKPELRVLLTAPENTAVNVGKMVAEAGSIGIFAGAIKQSGLISANSAVVGENGKIVLRAKKDITLDAGSKIEASGPQGGAITIQSDTGTASIAGAVDANGTQGKGGTISVAAPVAVTVAPTARVSANGTEGGSVTLDSSAGSVTVSAPVSADATVGYAGQIAVNAATTVALTAGQLSASGGQGGGTVAIQGVGGVTLDAAGSAQASGATGGTVSMASDQGAIASHGMIDVTATDVAGGNAQLTARSDIALDVGSQIRAGGRSGGQVYIESGEGTLLSSGLIDGQGSDGQGGRVLLLAPRVGLVRDSVVNVSGRSGGGTVLVGGDYQGKNPDVQNALQTYVGPGARIVADAIYSGNGGKVIIWADDITRFYGDISARGGAQGGDGGFVEVSGKDHLVFRGKVDTLAPHGKTGTLLLDPADITILNGTGNGAGDGDALSTTFTGTGGGGSLGTVLSGDTGPTTIFESELEGISALTNISVAASNSITINSLTTDGKLNLAQTGLNSVSFNAGAGGFTMANTANTITTAGGALNITTTGGATIGSLATGGGLITVNVGTASTVSGIIGGTGTALTKLGAGTLDLSGSNTYTGATNVNAGTLIASNASALGTTAGATTVASGATLNINNVNIGTEALNLAGTGVSSAGVLTGTGTAVAGGAAALTANASVGGAGTLTLGGAVAGVTFDLTKVGAGTLVLSGTNVFTGALNISGGVVSAATDANLGNGTLAFDGGTLLTTAGITSAKTVVLNAGGGTVDTNGFTSTLSGVISGLGAFTKAGVGTLILSGTNTYTAATSINAGVIEAQSNAALGTAAGNTTVASGAALQINGSGLSIAEPLSIAGTGVGGAGAIRNLANANALTGGVTLTGASRINSDAGTLTISTTGISGAGQNLTIGGAGNTTVSSAIGTTTGGITKDGAGTLTLSGANTYTGATAVDGGTLKAGVASVANTSGAFGNNSAVTLATASGVTLDITGFATQIGSLTGGGAAGGNVTLGAATLTVGGDSTSPAAYAGVISGTGAIDKIGTGTLILSGANTYTGLTTISAGTLKLGAAGDATNTPLGTVAGGTSVTAGATLDLNG
ncbi:MAG: autotransporter-associated beta strand repeat-containing protein, partial [Betaproteobacteria bacterium]|nr:autotransporter-associated beta strand repeat-containing protein [Betaproteobacteria bacterium]